MDPQNNNPMPDQPQAPQQPNSQPGQLMPQPQFGQMNAAPQPMPGPQPVGAPMPQQAGPFQQAPMQPSMPMGSAPGSGYNAKKPNKGLIIGLIAGGAALLIGLIVALVFMFAGPSKQDYKTALDTADKAQSAWSKIASLYVSSSSTKSELADATTTLKENSTEINKQLDELGKSKAVTGDKDVKEKWAKVTEKRDKFTESLTARQEAYEKIYPIFVGLDSPSSTAEARAMLVDMQTKVKAISGLTVQVNKDYVARLGTDLDKMVSLLDSTSSSARTEYYDTSADVSKAESTWKTAINKLIDESSISKEMNAVSDSLSDKYYKIK
jgi:hypothetical protein